MALSDGWHSNIDQLRSAVNGTAVNYSGGDQTAPVGCRGIYVGGAGKLACRLVGATADVTFAGLVAGNYYPFAIAIVRQASSTITNSVLLQ